ncbi:MAG: EAL domain-containing protein [Pseudomonadales bacterium]|nr:EAL domain-containing protein [Pseudomonadales bacterium]
MLELHHFAAEQSRALAEMQNRNQVLVESASEGIIQYDGTGSIQYVNPKTVKILGFTEENILDTSVFDLLGSAEDDPQEAEELINELTQGMLQHQPFTSNRVLLNTSKDSTIVAEISCNCTSDADGVINGHIMMFNDITARTINEQRLIKLAKYDVLTGLSNRSKFHDFTEGKIAYCAHNEKKLALLFIDIDHFKNTNDTMGHDAGDELLVEVAERLRNCVRETDLVARIGGDEFAITLLEMGSPNQVTRIVRHILEVLSKPYQVQDREIMVTASVGISLYPESGSDLKTLTQKADTAMYQAKVDARNTYRFFSTEIQNRVMEQSSLEEALRRAIANDEFFFHYQPEVDAVSGRVVGLEALIRWQHEDWPNIGPHKFIPVAEECGLLPAIGKCVLYSACNQAVEWREAEDIKLDFPIAVNLSPKQLVNGDFIEVLYKVLRDTNIPASSLVLELTETAVMHNPEVAINMLEKINSAGVMISVDDFGTGYSSLNYLKRLPIDKLKIDRSFVKDIGIDANGEAIVKAILALAHSLNLQVVAEGVEEETHVEFLRDHECEQLQGYFFSRPLPVKEVTEMLRQEKIKWEATFSGVGKVPEFDPIKIKPPFH